MRLATLVVALAMSPVYGAERVYYLYPLTPNVPNVEAIDLKHHEGAIAPLAKVASLKTPWPSSEFEVRVWARTYFGGGGFLFRFKDGKVFSQDFPESSGTFRAGRTKVRKISESDELKVVLASLGSLHDRSLSCGVMDGVDYYVEATANGTVVRFDANNPEQCRGEAAQRIKRLLAIMAGDA